MSAKITFVLRTLTTKVLINLHREFFGGFKVIEGSDFSHEELMTAVDTVYQKMRHPVDLACSAATVPSQSPVGMVITTDYHRLPVITRRTQPAYLVICFYLGLRTDFINNE